MLPIRHKTQEALSPYRNRLNTKLYSNVPIIVPKALRHLPERCIVRMFPGFVRLFCVKFRSDIRMNSIIKLNY
jgi:hypothetical protein